MKVQRTTSKSGIIARASLWSALAFALNLVWEIGHARLYTLWAGSDRINIAWSLLHCSLGDVAIALAAFALAGIALRQTNWLVYRPWAGGAIVIIGTMAYTVWSEWHNVYQVGNWSYTPSMPLVFGIGLSPLLQWLFLPPLMTIAYRALWLKWLDRHHTASPIPANGFTEVPK
ncbi:MAG: hypothetical protein EHM16_16135 [Betaproteobacteria bacterium]|nr:MAG: hypothetical protein EHM16_16135 [Betaproteobacteria bacterium]